MKDAPLKAMLYRHFRAQGWYAHLEVPVFSIGGVSESRRLITDVDVFAMRPSSDLRWEIVLGDCKTKKGESPANRSLWCRALMDQFSATRAILLLRRDGRSPIEPDHRLFASTLHVTIVEESEFETFDRALIYPDGSSGYPDELVALTQIRVDTPKRYPGLEAYAEYVFSDAWSEPDHFTLLRKTIAAARLVAKEVNPDNLHHLALVVEGIGAFSVALASCVGVLFHQYLQPASRSDLDNALRMLIWGGRGQYEWLSAIRGKLAEERRSGSVELVLPEWGDFLSLVRDLLDRPRLAFSIPHELRAISTELLGGEMRATGGNNARGSVLQLALLVALYYVKASGLPSDMRLRIRDLVLSKLQLSSTAAARDGQASYGDVARIETSDSTLPLPGIGSVPSKGSAR